jgi:WXXGXW repeat (2 copies)
MASWVSRVARSVAVVLAGCGGGGGGSPAPREPQAPAIRLDPVVAEQTWYRATTVCGQGPYEIELATSGARWGEDVALLIHAPHAVALHAEIVGDGAPMAQTMYGNASANTRCVADARERLALAHVGGSASGDDAPAAGVPGRSVAIAPTAPTAPPQLVVDPHPADSTDEILRVHLPPGGAPRIRIRVWSVAPNDLDGVLFGAARVVWTPNVSDAQYEAYLAEQAAAAADDDERHIVARARKDFVPADERPPVERPTVEIDAPPAAHAEDPEVARAGAREAEEERRRAEEAARRAEEAARRAEDEAHRQRIAAALEAERRARRAAFCAAHPDDRDCWGAGGLRVHLDLERRARERDAYCATAPDDARCWSIAERARRTDAWDRRGAAARAPPCQPVGAPPAARAEASPPRLSVNAEWRPGYWQWSGCTWLWLAGMWRVPDRDVAAGQTTTAPSAPPPPPTEVAPPAPTAAVIWVPGFWQWSGSAWVWIAGSYQLRPSPHARWRPAEWHLRGALHVLVPGGWIDVR